MPDPFIGTWTIRDTSNPSSYPKDTVQTIRKLGDSYVVTWRVNEEEASFSGLEAQSEVLLGSPTARGTIGIIVGTFNVEILVLPELRILAASSSPVPGLMKQTPGPLVGQWGAESTGNPGGEEKPKKDKDARPGKRPAK